MRSSVTARNTRTTSDRRRATDVTHSRWIKMDFLLQTTPTKNQKNAFIILHDDTVGDIHGEVRSDKQLWHPVLLFSEREKRTEHNRKEKNGG